MGSFGTKDIMSKHSNIPHSQFMRSCSGSSILLSSILEPFGLSARDAAEIIRKVAPRIQILFIRKDPAHYDAEENDHVFDLEEFKRTIHSIAV